MLFKNISKGYSFILNEVNALLRTDIRWEASIKEMFWFIVFLLIPAEFITSKFASTAEVCTKIKASTCQECIQSGPHCSWCKKVNFTKAGESDSVRCDTTNNLVSLGCDINDIIDPISEILFEDPQPLDEKVQLTPKQIELQLRPGETGEFEVKFRRAEGYPVDLYYLMDLSYSMNDDLQNVKKLGNQLLIALNGITKSAHIGFGSFVDKTVLPFVSTHPEQLRHPCTNKTVPCQPPFSFKHILKLTDDGDKFIQQVGMQQISGNLDSPEGGLDAMMQVAVCGDKIGWRNVTRLLVYATDDGFHIAGDGKLAAILTPNNGACHLEDNMYKKSNEFDYPSVGQLAQKLSENNIQVVFAVTSNMIKTYQGLSNLIPKSVVGGLSSDSSNVVQLITEAYQNLSSEVILDHGITPDFLDIIYDSYCSNGVNFTNTVRGVCSNVKINEQITFKVKVTAKKCLPDNSFSIRALGFTDTVKVSVITACDCKCEDAFDSKACNSNGKTVCGICSCNKGYLGKNCECVAGSKTSQELDQNCKKENGSAVCSGAGECICGQCICNTNDDPAKKIFGQYCECDNWNCEMFEGKVCAGVGTCDCGTCICSPGFDGSACQCKRSTDRCKTQGSICSGRGECECNKCNCKGGYIAPFCKTCPGCPSACPRFGPCVECHIKQEGQNSGNCTKICPGARVMKVEEVTEEPFCREKDSDNCWMQYYLYEEDGVDNFSIRYTLKRECPEAPNMYAIVGGTIAGVLLLGLICLGIWKIVTEITDRKEYQRFQKEMQHVKWGKGENPIFTTATTTVQNPNFDEDGE
ncbi:integrin beta-2 isoform X2 [Hyla sarda]|uniref:integrin beta-2 isoform X2 n=1 Tax=Hyla sarda TaxID=327740 RepID=UPI0024C24D74|nr:integrin beta-2 isoform X2 [Hyla sarda]